MRLSHREKLQLALANARESLGRDNTSTQPALSKLNTLRGVKEAIDTREGNLLSRTGVKTRPTFDIVADQILGEPTSWKPSIDLDEGENSLSQIAAKRIGEMRERQEIEEGEEELLGESFGMLKDGRPIWAEVLDTQRGYSTNFTDYGMKDLAFRPLWPPVQKLSDHNTWKSWHVVEAHSRASMACEKVIEKPGITMNPLLILGDTGCGKSHILSASVQAMIRRQDGNVHLLSTSAMRGWESLPDGWQDAVAHANLIAIDDLHLADERIATELGMMIDYALNLGVQVIATSRVDSNEWPARRLWEVMRSATSVWIRKPSSASLITHLRRNAGGRALLLDDAMIARIVKHGGGDWRSTDAAFEKVALAVESGERIISGDDVTSILEEVPQEMTEVELFTEREDLEEIASRVISETLDHVYTGRDVAGVELNVPIPELSDDWEVPELTIEEKDELHEVLTSKNLTPHVTTTLTVDESDEFLVHRDDNLDALDQVRVAETTSSIDSITDQMFERMSNEHIEQSKKLAELEQEMFDLADRSRDASVEELIEIADRVGEIEVILGNVQEPPKYAMLTPGTVLTPIGEEA
ncbi:MAG: DnaA/Hda family protein [Candidatus Poseidoniaceae archaeon]|nr:DnaA/Hda family protein [Candidatus Poseidoniaceae archaeon]